MNDSLHTDETEIDLKRLFKQILNKWLTIVSIGILGALVAGLISVFIMVTKPEVIPTYRSTTSIKIHFMDDEKDQQIDAALELIRSKTVASQVIKELELEKTYESFLKSLSVEKSDKINVLDINVLSSDPSLAKEMADKVRMVAVQFIANSMDVNYFKTIEQASLPLEPLFEEKNEESLTSILTKVLIGGFLGALGAVFVIFTKFALNNRIQTPEDVQRYLGKRVLASIPMVDKANTRQSKKTKGRREK